MREELAAQIPRIQETAKAIAQLDVYASLSVVAQRNNYVRPTVNTKGVIDIKNGRHPVVEKMINNDMFIANDTYLDNGSKRVSVITGPNMAGKIHVYAADCPDRSDGTDRFFRSGRESKDRCGRPYFHPCRSFGRPGQRTEYVHGGDDRGG